MSEPGYSKKLFELDEQIQNELLAMQDTLSWFPEGDLDNERYLSFSNRITYIDTLFNKADIILRGMTIDQSQPDLISLLEAKDNIQVNRDRFHRMSHEFHLRFDKDELSQEEERERVMERSAESVQEAEQSEDELAEPIEDDFSDEELLEEWLAAEAEAEEEEKKAKKKKAEAKRSAERRARERQAFDAQNRADAAAADAARRDRDRRDAERRWEEDRRFTQPTPLYTPLYEQPYSQQPYPTPTPPPAPLQPTSQPTDTPPAPYWKDEAELRQMQYREAERRSHEERIRQEQTRLHEEQLRRFHEQPSQPRYAYDRTVYRHFDFSVLEGEKASRHNGRTEYKVYSYTPDGTVELGYNRDLSSAPNNQAIASNIGNRVSRPASSAYEATMRFNMQMARQNYESKRGTPEEKAALREYIRQRESLVTYRDNIRSGRTETFSPTATPHEPSKQTRRDYFSDTHPIRYQYTPDGVVGNSIASGRLSGSQMMYRNTPSRRFGQGGSTHITTPQGTSQRSGTGAQRVPQNVLRKSPVSDVPVIVPATQHTTPARFKVTGVSSADIRTSPNGVSGSEWLKSVKLQAHNRSTSPSPATTAIPYNSGKKSETKEVSSNVVRKKSKLNSAEVAKYYAGKMGTNTLYFSKSVVQGTAKKMYQMAQGGDENNPLGTFEAGRHYMTTAVGVTSAVMHAKVVSSTRTIRQGALMDHGYGQVAQMSKREFARELQMHREKGRALREEIRALKSKGVNMTGDEMATLASKLKEKAALNHEARKLHSYRNFRLDNAAAVAMDRAIEAEAKGRPIRIKHVQAAKVKLEMEAKERLEKKFGNLQKLKNEELAKRITASTAEARALKKQIVALKKKGALSSVENAQLMALKKRKAELDAKLRKYHGLRLARDPLNRKISAGNKRITTLTNNRYGILSGLSALQDFILRPLKQDDMIGAQGLAKGFSISTNHYVHEFVKSSVRYSISTGRWAMRTTHLDSLARYTGKAIVRSRPVRATKATAHAAKEVVKGSAKTGAAATKEAMSRLAPKPVKTAVKKGYHAATSIPGRYGRAKAAVKGAAAATKNWFYGTRVGRAYAWANKVLHGFTDAVKVAWAFVKGLVVKGLLILGGFILLVLLIVTVITSLGGAATSVMLVPGSTEDGKFDLSPYNNILVREWEEYEQELLDMGDAEGYYRTTVEIEPNVPNAREILSMMSVRMSQRLDLRTNLEIEPYLSQLMRDLNPYVREESTCYCEGRNCRTGSYTVTGTTTDAEGNTVTTSHTYYYTYCNGDHPTLTVKLYSLHFDAAFSADSMGAADAGVSGAEGDLIGRFKITYYCAEKYPHICNAGPPYETATGTTPTAGRTIAVDPSVIPLNTRVIIDGHEYVAEDTGGAIDGNRIDIVVATHAEALRKGTRNNVPVYSVSYEGSDMIESGYWNGWTDGNKEWAKNIYSQDWTQLYSGIPNVTDLVGNNTDLSGVEFIDGDRPGYDAIANAGRGQLGNAGGQKFWSWYGFDYRVEWCAIFVSWCANQTGNLNSAVPKFALCEDGIRWYQSRGQWAARGDTTPVAGDIIFFDWGADGDPDHVGIVVGSDGTNVYTVEGNSGDQVRTKSYALNSNVIFGYGLPNY